MSACLYKMALTNQSRSFLSSFFLSHSVTLDALQSYMLSSDVAISENISYHKKDFLSIMVSYCLVLSQIQKSIYSCLPYKNKVVQNKTKCGWHVWKEGDDPKQQQSLQPVSSWLCQYGIIIRKSFMSVAKGWHGFMRVSCSD